MKKTFTQKRVCEKRGRSFFLSLFVLLLFAGITKNAQAQIGAACSNPIRLTSNNCINDSIPADSVRWYSFTATATSVTISEKLFSASIGHVHTIALLNTCGGTVLASKSITATNDSLLSIKDSTLTIGTTYYVALLDNEPGCARCLKGQANYQICLMYNPDVANDCIGAIENGENLGTFCCGGGGTFASGIINVCVGNTIVFYADTSNETGSYYNTVNWVTPGGTPSSATKYRWQLDTVQFNTVGTYYIYYYYVGPGGDVSCSMTVNVIPPPVASFTFSPNPVCFNDTVTFIGHPYYFVPFGSPSSMTWVFGAGDTVLGCTGFGGSYKCDSIETHVFNAPGSYPVTYIVSNGACSDTITHIVTVNGPTAFFKYKGICLGSPTSFFASSSCTDDSVKYHWNFGDGFTSNVQNPVYTFPNPGSYTVTLTITDDGYTYSTTQTVKIDNPPTAPVLTGPADGCAANVQVCVNPPVTGDTYSWVSNGASGAVSGTGTCTTAPGNLSTGGGTVFFTVTDSAGCQDSSQFVVNKCCEDTLSSSVVFNDQTATQVLAYLRANNPTYLIGKNKIVTANNFYINGTLTVDTDLIFVSCSNVRLGTNAFVNVIPGDTLTIEESHFYASCGQMWNGIYVPYKATLNVIAASKIENAINAVVSYNGGVYNVLNSFLNNDHIGILVDAYANHHTGIIRGSTISCGNLSSGTLDTLISPYAGQITEMGIKIDSVTNANPIVIGNPALATYVNKFINLTYGIYGYNSTFTVVNNEMHLFNDGIYATALVKGTPAKTVIVGEQGNNNHRNYFFNGNTGVFINGGMNAYITKNTFRNLRSTGVTVANCRSLTQKIDTNSFYSVPGAMGVYADENYFDNMLIEADTVSTASVALNFYQNIDSKITIQNNSISYKPNPFSYATAVLINESYYSYATHYVAYNNDISKMRYGIKTNGLRGAIIYKNTINLEAYTDTSYYSGGIYMAYSIGCHIESNDVLAVNRSNYWVDAIRLESSSADTLTCNYTSETGTGLFFSNAQPATYIAKNTMYYNHEGIVLNNNGMIDAQYTTIGGVKHPNDNTWTPFLGYSGSNPNTFSFNSNGNLDTLYVRNIGVTFIPIFNTSTGSPNIPIPYKKITGNLNSLFCPITVLPGPPLPTGFTLEARAIAQDSVLFPINLKQTQWWSKQHLFHYLKSNPAFATSQPVLQTFKDSVAIANMGTLDSVNNVLANAPDSASLLTSAQNMNAAISPTDSIEGNMQSVNAMMLNSALSDTTLNAAQISALRVIANECPYIYGPAVYQARALLASYDSLGTVYVNSCEIIPESTHHTELRNVPTQTPTEFKLYPNPNNGNMTLEYSISQGDKGELEIYDFTGRKLNTYSLDASSNTMNISEAQLSDGIYFYRIIVNNINIKSDKLIIIK